MNYTEEEALELLHQLQKITSDLASEVQEMVREIDFIPSEISSSRMARLRSKMLSLVDDAVMTALSPDTFPERGGAEYIHFLDDFMGIKINISGDALLLQLPRLLPRRYRPDRSADTYGQYYRDAARYAMTQLINHIPPQQFQNYIIKTVCIIAVYPSSTKQIPDTDSYDTKTIIDAVTGSLPGGDGAPGCSIYLHTIQLTIDQPRTLIAVLPGSTIPEDDDIVRWLCELRGEIG